MDLDIFNDYLNTQLGYRVEAQRVLIEMFCHDGKLFTEIAIYYMEDDRLRKYVVKDEDIFLKLEPLEA